MHVGLGPSSHEAHPVMAHEAPYQDSLQTLSQMPGLSPTLSQSEGDIHHSTGGGIHHYLGQGALRGVGDIHHCNLHGREYSVVEGVITDSISNSVVE